MNVAEYIVNELSKRNISHIFGYQGGNITYVIDAIGRTERIKYIQTYNEQGAAFAANSYAQITNNFGVAVSSSGPGAINMMNGIANAYYDSIPCLFITGNINVVSMRKDDSIRQNGFQETDIVNMVSGITKYAITVHNADKIDVILEEALNIMKMGRPGPVLLDIPHNIQRAEIVEKVSLKKEIVESNIEVGNELFQDILNKLNNAVRPVLLLGGGCRSDTAKQQISCFLEKVDIPIVASLCGIDVICNSHRCYRGMIGSYGLPASNKILQEADFVLVLGSRLDERQRNVNLEQFLRDATVVHVDIDKNELKNVIKSEISICASVEQFMTEMNQRVTFNKRYDGWLGETKKWFKEKARESDLMCGSLVQDKLRTLIGNYAEDTIICVDVGNHQMASSQALRIGENSRFLNSGGLGSMGYAVPASIGAYYADSKKRVICITGDGGIMMNLQELQVIAREKLPITIIIINNKELGMIRTYQNLAFEGRSYGAKWGYTPPDFSEIAKTFNMEYFKVEEAKEFINNWAVPAIIEIEV